MNRLTKFDYLVNVLLGSILFSHTLSFYPWAVSCKGAALNLSNCEYTEAYGFFPCSTEFIRLFREIRVLQSAA
jgi:hypothetical protein